MHSILQNAMHFLYPYKFVEPTFNTLPDGGTMSDMRYADTNFLIVTCYLLLPPFYLPSTSLATPIFLPF